MAGSVCYTLSPAWSPHPPSWTLTSSSGQWSQLMAFIWTNSLSWLVSSTCHTIPCLLVYGWSFSPLWVSVTITMCTYVRLWASCRCLTQGVHPGMAEDINTHALASLLFLLFHKHLSISLGGALCTSPSVFFLLIPLSLSLCLVFLLVCMQVLSHFSRLRLCNPMDYVAHQAPLSVGFPKQEYWSGLPFHSVGDLPNPGIKPVISCFSGTASGFIIAEPLEKPLYQHKTTQTWLARIMPITPYLQKLKPLLLKGNSARQISSTK